MTIDGSKIVAIDDTSSIRTFLRVSLEDEGASFYGASTALSGLKTCEEVRPDLVILDLGLPDRDGLDILPTIKQADGAESPIVVVLTVRKNRETIERAMSLGADAYLSKPFIVEDLLDIIEQSLN